MTADQESSPPPLTDSPWFWAYAFGTAGLIGVSLLGWKADRRQAQLDANYTRRQELLEQRAGKEPGFDDRAPADEERYVLFSPLLMLIAALTMVAWGLLWWSRYRRPQGKSLSAENVR